MTKILFLCLSVLSLSSFATNLPCDISGTWKHSLKEAWLDVDLVNQQITVKTHVTNPNAEGLVVIKGLLENSELEPRWSGKMYDASVNGYIDVQLTSSRCKQLIVSDNSVEILKLIRE